MNKETYLGQGPRFNGSAALVADESVGFTIRYIGSEASATVTVASGVVTCKAGDAGSEAADTTVGASGVVDPATYTTMGAMIDAINKSPNWRAELVDALRADASAAHLNDLSETTLSPKREPYNLLVDTSGIKSVSYLISHRRGDYKKSQKGLQAFLARVKGLCNVGSGTLTLSIIEVDETNTSVRTLATFDGTDNTELDTGEFAAPLISGFGNSILVRYAGSVDWPDSGMYLRVQGYNE